MGHDDDKKGLHDEFDDLSHAEEASFFHPNGAEILEQTRKILEESASGRHLLNVAQQYGIKTAISNTQNLQGYHPETSMVFLYAAPDQKTANVKQVLDLSGFMRVAEQGIVGFKGNEAGDDAGERDALLHAKNLDMIVETCKIAVELKSNEKGPALTQEILNRGYRKIYEAYKEQRGQEALIAAYIEAVEEKKK